MKAARQFASPDAEFDRLVAEGVLTSKNLCATSSEHAYGLADVVVVDVQLDVVDRAVESAADIQLRLSGLEAAIRVIGRHMRPDALVMVETTVPFGACERLICRCCEKSVSVAVQASRCCWRMPMSE